MLRSVVSLTLVICALGFQKGVLVTAGNTGMGGSIKQPRMDIPNPKKTIKNGNQSVSSSLTAGSVIILENGVKKTRYVVSQSANQITVENNNAITLRHDNRAYIALRESDTWSSDMFQWYTLAGKTLSFTVDLSGLSCSCNGAFYLVTMPGVAPDGSSDPSSSGDYYCDANKVSGVYCWEMDVMEANKYVTQVTPHQCNSAAHTYTSWCDGGGCATNARNVNQTSMGPSSNGYSIDTTLPFNYSVSFDAGNGDIHARLSQKDKSFSFDVCGQSGYLQSMMAAERSEWVMVLSYWGNSYETMSWLDSNTGCNGDCDTSGYLTVSDISIG